MNAHPPKAHKAFQLPTLPAPKSLARHTARNGMTWLHYTHGPYTIILPPGPYQPTPPKRPTRRHTRIPSPLPTGYPTPLAGSQIITTLQLPMPEPTHSPTGLPLSILSHLLPFILQGCPIAPLSSQQHHNGHCITINDSIGVPLAFIIETESLPFLEFEFGRKSKRPAK